MPVGARCFFMHKRPPQFNVLSETMLVKKAG
jgi:hypothetical protein